MAEPSRAMREFAANAADSAFSIQRCAECGRAAWPPRDICAGCWSADLRWTPASRRAVVLAETALHAPLGEFFRGCAPWRVGTVKLAEGGLAYAHLHESAHAGDKVMIDARTDFAGRTVLVARRENARLEDDARLVKLFSRKKGGNE